MVSINVSGVQTEIADEKAAAIIKDQAQVFKVINRDKISLSL
jgi:hypothetical protein